MIDIFSRYIDDVNVQARESGHLTEEMMREVFEIHGIHRSSTPTEAPR